MHRQPSRSAANMDAIDCIVTTNDLAMENDILVKESEQRRGANSSSRRDQTSKRSNEKSTRRSPPSVTRKHEPSPRSSSSSRPQHQLHYPSSQRYRRVSSSSTSPPPLPPQASSHRDRRPATTVKRPHSPSRSPHGRRGLAHRSRPESTRERTMDNAFTSTPSVEEQSRSKKTTSKQDTADLSLISEDESIKPRNNRSNGLRASESPSIPKDSKLHSTPSLPILQPNSNESLLEMSTTPQDCELSLFAKSALSTNNTSSILTTPANPTSNLMQTLELFSKYQVIQASANKNQQIKACSEEIFQLLTKELELQKKELNCREREMKLRERQLDQREKQFNEKSHEATSFTSVQSEPLLVLKSISVEDKPQQKPEIVADQNNTKTVSKEESDVKSSTNSSAKDNSLQPSLTRRNHGKSRFSQNVVDPSIFASSKPVPLELYSDDHDESQSSPSINTATTVKKCIIPKILAPNESTMSLVDGDLKVTSSNSCRKVEYQIGTSDKAETSKGSSHDLRLILSNNRTKQQNDDDDEDGSGVTDGIQLIHGGDDDEDDNQQQTVVTNKEDKYPSHEYSQQRSVTSTSLEAVINNNNDRRVNRHHQQHRTDNNRRPYVGQSSSSSSNERSYNHGLSSQQQSKYGSNAKRHETDLRSRLPGQNKHAKASRPTHQNNY